MKIGVRLQGFDEEAALFSTAARRYGSVLAEQLQIFGDETVDQLQLDMESNAFNLPPKAHDNGKPPLIDSEKYEKGYSATVRDRSMEISSKGMNDHMSNVEVGELLEYGNGSLAAKPHLRPTEEKMMNRSYVLVERIFHELFRGT